MTNTREARNSGRSVGRSTGVGAALLGVSLWCAGCSRPGLPETGDPRAEVPEQHLPPAPTPGVGPTPPGVAPPGTPSAATGYCAPQPAHPGSELAPELLAWVRAAEGSSCRLERRTSGGVTDGFPTPLELFAAPGSTSCDGGDCFVELPAVARAWTHRPPPMAFSRPGDLEGERWAGTIRAKRHATTGELHVTVLAMEYGSTAARRLERRFDRAGHLLEDRYHFGGALWFTWTNTWDGARLVASRFVDGINRTGVTERRWSYRGDRLVRSTVTHRDSGRVGSADFTYDAAGRLTAVERAVDGARWARQEWVYAADGRLQQSRTELAPKLYQEGGALRGSDDLEPLVAAFHQREWTAARPERPAAGGCATLPHAMSYGYPEADGVYALGWPVGDRPAGLDGDYGFGPAYDTGIDRWFGHDRVEGMAWHPVWDAPVLRAELAYDVLGRMVAERLSGSDGSVTYERTRALDGERVASDVRLLHRDGQRLVTALTFVYDRDGRLVTRAYRMNGVLVAQHGWAYEGAEVSRHTIARHAIASRPTDGVGAIPEGLGQLPATLPPPVLHERRFSAGGRRIAIYRNGNLLEERTRDAAGRILSRLYPPGSLHAFSYDATGELASYYSGAPADATHAMRLSYERAPDGRLLARHWGYYAGRSDTDRFTYLCK
ncbi:MAG: hypothetical protein IT371_10270 [Deltaproteobacteria bacterium]|nr:hypothetical protein [Deltaproteobacteria bacterium]